MTGNKRGRERTRGSVIVLAVFVVLFMALLMLTLELLHRSEFEDLTNQIDEMKAYYCAEAGVERYMYKMRNAAAPPTGVVTFAPGGKQPQCNTETQIGNNWMFRVTASRTSLDSVLLAGPPALPAGSPYRNVFDIYSTGYASYSNGFTRTIYVRARRTVVKQGGGDYYYQILHWQEQ